MRAHSTAAAIQAAAERAFGQAATHMHRRDEAGRYTGPLCGQVSANGTGWARTHYTAEPAQVTCRKCRRAMEKAAGTATATD